MSTNTARVPPERQRVLSLVLGVGLALLVMVLPQGGLSAQSEDPGWRFMADPLADLWFHGMALVDPVGPGPTPLYDPSYPGRVQRAKTSMGIPTTSLDNRLGYFRNAFRNDPAFEVLHFVPLYFPRAGRLEVFSALKALAATSQGVPSAPTERTSFGLAAVGSVLTAQAQRELVGEFVQSLEEEWVEFYQNYDRSLAANREAVLGSLQETWGRKYSQALAPFLNRANMTAGLVLISPSLGTEGRVFTGSGEASWDNVLAVSAPRPGQDPSHALFAMIREISFPLVRRAMASLSTAAGSEGEEERRAARGAVRSGALILQAFSPDDVEDYQSFFLSEITGPVRPGTVIEEAFRAAYPLGQDLEEALRKEILPTAQTRR